MSEQYTLSNHGYWLGTNVVEEHMFDASLAKALIDFFPADQSILDLGCGLGHYVEAFRSAGLNCDGVDGNPNTPELTEGRCGVADLAIPLSFNPPYEWAMSLEVAEHIPAKYERTYLQNLDSANKRGIVMSWGLPGQTGLGHVNCRDNEYVKCRLAAMGYQHRPKQDEVLRQAATLEWFKYTVMVFERG